MTAVAADPNLARLRELARVWREQDRDYAPAFDLDAVLDEIEAAKAAGGDLLSAFVKANSIPKLHAAALEWAADLWGPDAELSVEATDTITCPSSRHAKFATRVYVRCLNYASLPAYDPEESAS